MAAVCKECEEYYDLNNIYNVDETGLLYRVLPRRTYLAPSENRKTARGVKGMKAKELFTTYICVNASGTAKMPLVVIGTAANPRCFSQGKILLPKDTIYLNQTGAWSDTRTFGLWLRSFLRYVSKIKSKPVLLVIDNQPCQPGIPEQPSKSNGTFTQLYK